MVTSMVRSLPVRSCVISSTAACIVGGRLRKISQHPKKQAPLHHQNNGRIREGAMNSFGWIVMSSLVVFFVPTSPSWAQTAASPPTNCEDGSIGSCVGDLLDEELEMIDQVELLLRDMQAMGLLSLAQDRFAMASAGPDTQADFFARINTLRNEHARAMAANDATPDSEYDEMFQQADKEKGKNCKFSDINFFNSVLDANGDPDPALLGLKSIPTSSKFGNGKCDIFEAVNLEDETVKVNERKENMCEKVCTEKPNQQGKSKGRAVGGLIDALASARGANLSLVAQRASILELGSILSDLQSSASNPQFAGADPCAPGTPGPGADLIAARVFNITITVFDGVIVVGNIVTEVLKTVADIADKPCKQTVAGFNASAACIPFTVAFHISKGIFDLLKGARTLIADARSIVATEAKIVSAGKIDQGKACSKIIRDDTVKLKGEFGGGQCVNLVCDGGPDDSNVCANDGDCSRGAIVILQGAVDLLNAKAGQTSAKLAEVTAELAVMKSLLEETRDFLLTPQGRRKGFKGRP